jgi:hypothetical protein
MLQVNSPIPPGLGSAHPGAITDFEFYQRNKMTRAEMAERNRQWERSNFETGATSDLDGDLPLGGIVSDVVGVLTGAPERQKLAGFVALRAAERIKLSDLETKKAELLGLVEAPAATESKISAAVRKTADWLRGRNSESSSRLAEIERGNLDTQLATERHRADAAKSIMPELEHDIEVAQLRVKRLDEREREYLEPALREVKVATGVFEYIAKKKAELEAAKALLEDHPWWDVEAALLEGKDFAKLLPKIPGRDDDL